jgi:hypothetical protein
MRRHDFALLVLGFAALTPVLGFRLKAAAGPLPPLVNLAPGTDLRIQQDVDVNIVLVGFGGLVDPAAMFAQPYALAPWNGVPKANGQGHTFIGQRFDFRYHITAAPAWFDDALFTLLRQTAVPQTPIPIFQGLPPMPVTPAQAIYSYCNLDPAFDPTHGCSFDPSAPRVNTRVITQNYLLNAAFVEKVLSQNLPSLLGVDVTKPTVVLLNWWGRPDYVDHIYVDPGEPDPETGFPRGLRTTNELAGYGATNDKDPETCQGDCIFHRLWFYDVSAGPMQRTGGFDLVSDVPRFIGATNFGLPYPDYRFHHPADYVAASGTYRPLTSDDLVWDATALAGLVFTSQIAYANPLYPPALTPPTLPRRLVLDINQWSWSGESFAGLLDTPRLIGKMKALPYDIGVEVTGQPDGPDSKLGRVWQCSLTSITWNDPGQSCYGNETGGYAPGDLQTYFADHLFQFLNGAPDHEVPIFQFNVPPELDQHLWIAVAYDKYVVPAWTPTLLPAERQSFIFTSKSPFTNSFVGNGQLLEHETGHHLGFSHPFQGYLCLTDTCGVGEFFPFGGNPFLFFSMSGNYVSGLMTYAAVNNDYSRFELDNIQRWLTWEYLDVSNFIVGQIGASPRSGSVAATLTQADTLAGAALAAYRTYDYASAEQSARAAYDTLFAAADAIQVHLSPAAYQAIRRDPADFNQALRDHIASVTGDSRAAMLGDMSSDGIRGLEAHPVLPSAQLATALPHPTRISLR